MAIEFDASHRDRKSTRLNSSHANISYAVVCLKKIRSYYTFLASTLSPAALANCARPQCLHSISTLPLLREQHPQKRMDVRFDFRTFFFFMKRRPPKSTLFPYSRSPD